MNQKLLYEQIISEKLDRVPVPDMADAIWARIEGQLDLDLPTDDGSGGGGNSQAPQAPFGGGTILGGAGLLTVVAALVITYVVSRNKNESTFTPSSITAPAKEETPVSQPITTTPINSRTVPFNTTKQDRRFVPLQPASDSGIVQAAVQPVPVPLQDSAANDISSAGITAPVVPQSSDTVAVKKKKGVQGLTDADYRIVPAKKDSAKN